MIVSIHQPNFFPWTGYFYKIANADIFVFLDRVQFSKGTHINRVKLLLNGKTAWVTCPVRHGGVTQLIGDVQICGDFWKAKFLKTLNVHYAKSRYYASIISIIEGLLSTRTTRLSDFNIRCIRKISREIGLSTRFVNQSEFESKEVFETSGSERLSAICSELKADTYIAGDGSHGYENIHCYKEKNILFKRSNFKVSPYSQMNTNTFIPGLSILDALFNIGPQNLQDLLFQHN